MTATAKKETAAEKAGKESAARSAAIAEADATYREDVKAAGEKRAKALAKVPGTGNLAETAWANTKSDEDPAYNDLALDFRQKLDAVVDAVRTTGNAGVVGLEEFEAEVVKLLEAEKPSTALAVATGGRPAEPAAHPAHPAPADAKKPSK